MSSVLLIDGYNLLWAANITADGPGASTLAGSRGKLLSSLVQFLPEAESARTTVVFDAAQAPPGLPRSATFRGVRIYFASDHDDADAMLEELISSHPAPKRLTVVSSDHRVQNAARRRRATAVDSDVWFRSTAAHSRRPGQAAAKPVEVVAPGEVDAWLAQFGMSDDSLDLLDAPTVNRWGEVESLPPPGASAAAGSPTSHAHSAPPSSAGEAPRRPRGRMKSPEPPKQRLAVNLDAEVLAEAQRLAAGEGSVRADLSPQQAIWQAKQHAARRKGSRAASPPPTTGEKAHKPDGSTGNETRGRTTSPRPTPPTNQPAPRKGKDAKRKARRPPTLGDDAEAADAGFNPFPEGYGDDLLD